jgi:RNA polymerase sigma-70 factor (ECF subfamily)
MNRVKEGELDQLGLLFERYKIKTFGFFFNMFGDVELSEDLVQNTFMRIIRYRTSFSGEGPFAVWLFRIARNVGNDHYRKNGVRHSNIAGMEELPEETMNREEAWMQSEELTLLRMAMERLDYEKREILMLSKIDGMRYAEIGRILDCNENAVKTKVFRAMKALKSEFKNIRSKV